MSFQFPQLDINKSASVSSTEHTDFVDEKGAKLKSPRTSTRFIIEQGEIKIITILEGTGKFTDKNFRLVRFDYVDFLRDINKIGDENRFPLGNEKSRELVDINSALALQMIEKADIYKKSKVTKYPNGAGKTLKRLGRYVPEESTDVIN